MDITGAEKDKSSGHNKQQKRDIGYSLDQMTAEDFTTDQSLFNYSSQIPGTSVQKKAIQKMESPEEEELQMKKAPVQKMSSPEEEELQMKKGPIQKSTEPEEEELQMKAAPLQKQAVPEEEELQMKSAAIQKMAVPEEEELQMKKTAVQKMAVPEEEELQMKESPVQKKSTNGSAMPAEVQMKMESSFGTDFSGVNIHANDDSATQMGALAYTQGNDVHFAPGQYNPQSQSGQELLGHELTHVVQQRQGRVQATTQQKGVGVNDDAALEKEADDIGKKAAEGKETFLKTGNQEISNSSTVQQKSPSWWDSIKKGASVFLDTTLKDEGSAYAKALMRHYLLGGGSEFNPETSSINFPTDNMWSGFMSSRPEIQRAMFHKFSSLALAHGTGKDKSESFTANLTGVKLNELESMRWTLHGCHRIEISGTVTVTSSGTDKFITFSNVKFEWFDVGDMHPGTKTETDSGEMVDDADFTGAGGSFPIKIPFQMPENSSWKLQGDGTLSKVSGWPNYSAKTASPNRE